MKYLKPKLLCAFAIFVMAMVFYFCITKPKSDSPEGTRVLDSLSKTDRALLTDFFDELVINHVFCYTLFGNKPVSWAAYFIQPFTSDLLLQNNSKIFLHRGVKVWNTHKKLFHRNKYILKTYKDQNVQSIYLINKQAFVSVVDKEIDCFKKILGSDVTSKSLLDCIEQDDSYFNKVLKPHDDLLGILLGYGKSNAVLFKRYLELENTLFSSTRIPYQDLGNEKFLQLTSDQKFHFKINETKKVQMQQYHKPASLKNLQEMVQEYVKTQSLLQPTFCSFTLQRFLFPMFRADLDSEETKELLSDYKTTLKYLSEVYENNDFLEITLQKLMEE